MVWHCWIEVVLKMIEVIECDQLHEASAKKPGASNGKVALLVRLYFSTHEKLSEQRWLDRIPSEEPFKSASPKVVQRNDPEFESTDKQFEALE